MNHFRALILSGERCDRDILLWTKKIFGEKLILPHYGQTETGSAISGVCLGYEKHPVR